MGLWIVGKAQVGKMAAVGFSAFILRFLLLFSAAKTPYPAGRDDASGRSSSHPFAVFDSLSLYFRQPVVLANLSLATLYMTVLSLGFLMTSYLKWSGLTEAEVSLYRGIGAITGLLATFIYPSLRRGIGLLRCGLLGISYQLLCLSLGVLPVLYYTLEWGGGDGSPTEGGASVAQMTLVRILIAGVVASRTGVWLFDLAVSQLVQELVPQSELGECLWRWILNPAIGLNICAVYSSQAPSAAFRAAFSLPLKRCPSSPASFSLTLRSSGR